MTPEDFYKALKELGFDLSQKQKETRSTSNISTIP